MISISLSSILSNSTIIIIYIIFVSLSTSVYVVVMGVTRTGLQQVITLVTLLLLLLPLLTLVMGSRYIIIIITIKASMTLCYSVTGALHWREGSAVTL